MPRAFCRTDETNEVPQNQAPDTNITITNVVFNPERNEINGTTLPNATITATVVGDASAQAGVFMRMPMAILQ